MTGGHLKNDPNHRKTPNDKPLLDLWHFLGNESKHHGPMVQRARWAHWARRLARRLAGEKNTMSHQI